VIGVQMTCRIPHWLPTSTGASSEVILDAFAARDLQENHVCLQGMMLELTVAPQPVTSQLKLSESVGS
jgi:hypothetical protein